jgi:hypothetical protein
MADLEMADFFPVDFSLAYELPVFETRSSFRNFICISIANGGLL